MNKTITVCLGLVLVLGGVYFASKGPWGKIQEEKSAGFKKFRDTDFSAAKRIEIGKGKGARVVLEKKDGQWVVASAYGYKADPKVAEDIIKSVSGIRKGEEVAELKESHKNFEVDDVRGSRISFLSGDGNPLGALVVGKTGQSR
ncbi:MAG: hypothetical protein MK133_08425, partial [Planctomycetes bacterium]|nr:hypothetical protein [Planctomycetota bacterium]